MGDSNLSVQTVVKRLLELPEIEVRSLLESFRWAHQVRCPECDSTRPIYKQKRRDVEGYYRCPRQHHLIEKVSNVVAHLDENNQRKDQTEMSDLAHLNLLKMDSDPGADEAPAVEVSYRPYGPNGYYVLNGLEEIGATCRPLVFNVRYKTLLMGSNVTLATWLAFICLASSGCSMSQLARLLKLTRKTVTRMHRVAIEQLKSNRRDNLFILRTIAAIENQANTT